MKAAVCSADAAPLEAVTGITSVAALRTDATITFPRVVIQSVLPPAPSYHLTADEVFGVIVET
jgi:hypothetical protein